ncbi:MAG TPA: sugar ABC transporter ATP-binding protein [Fimbriimonadaceae bacterium]|nr:sugar ABC transporter ATP-binding protein [Fimbriimonadaceae bacterium]
MSAILELTHICKRFPGVVALDDVSVSIERGSCHALMGENGAGKSTLGKIVAGIYKADDGKIVFDGKEVAFGDPGQALDAGIGMVHQELLFCENLTVAENLALGHMPHNGPFVNFGKMRADANAALARFGSDINPDRRLGDLPISRQQTVQIASALARGAKILIFDEPTSSLSHAESERLFEVIEQLKKDGVTCIYVSHRLNEVFRLCDTITVLKDGRHVVTQPTKEFTEETLVQSMIGRDLDLATRSQANPGELALNVEHLSSQGKFEDISLKVHAGEIVGISGLVGSGRTEVLESIFGLDPNAFGKIEVEGKQVRIRDPRMALRLGLGLVPEDRKRHGLVLSMKVRENMTLTILRRLSAFGFVRQGLERKQAKSYFDRLRVRAPSLEAPTSGLSGGTQQKLVIAKWVAADCKVLMVDEPTRGVDVGAKQEIHDILREMAKEGRAVLVVSSELPEMLALATRILVMRQGRIVGELDRDDADEEKLIRLMTGV